ncbi:NAD-dependent protein deacetylase Sirt6 [Habropoda laboriosa]|uniref:protein acetyllysine N-acetyltransferase n=1 Tax=Habropoda laboriosa TaxID=597456 RepID=A0A0L7R8F1_9HYME|nr:PREDICTED: NAD-dependent protein deacetylase Sirt6 [Habropoda laboriosa]KOC67162.1 NAD-dependent protein deacetylase Sirt6 [Habropoda laboriosa]
MSCSYADGLSQYENKGVLGLEERYDSVEALRLKCGLLADWIKAARHVVVHTGAGISTAAGIPDFRGTNGVWTLEQKGLKPTMNISFDEAIPTKTHMALKRLVDGKKIKFIISQNIDGLHLRSGVQRQYLAELHGNMFTEQCDKCGRQFIRNFATKSVGKKSLDTVCRSEQIGGRPCRGRMHDTILDWEHNLPDSDLTLSDLHSSVADLSICLGTTLQIIPSGNLPLYTKKYGGRLVICNLQPTKHDKKADLIINGNVDEIMISVMKKLGLEIPEYESTMDPTRNSDTTSKEMDWTIPTSRIKEMNVLYKKVCKPMRRKRKTFMYERERTDTKRETKTKKQAFMMKQDMKEEDTLNTANQVCNNAVVTGDISSSVVKIEDEMKDVEPFDFSTDNMIQPDPGLQVNDIL